MSDTESALFANDRFYVAFASKDMDAMEAIWAADGDVTCIHPGWRPLYGRDEVIASWRGIFNGEPPDVRFHVPKADLHGDVAIVTCIEQLGPGQYLCATNVFKRRGNDWAMVHHQAGPANVDVRTLPEDEPKAVN